MRTRRAIFPVVLTITAFGSILAGSAVPLVAASAPSVAVAAASPNTYFHG
jgi:hypothetical protein